MALPPHINNAYFQHQQHAATLSHESRSRSKGLLNDKGQDDLSFRMERKAMKKRSADGGHIDDVGNINNNDDEDDDEDECGRRDGDNDDDLVNSKKHDDDDDDDDDEARDLSDARVRHHHHHHHHQLHHGGSGGGSGEGMVDEDGGMRVKGRDGDDDVGRDFDGENDDNDNKSFFDDPHHLQQHQQQQRCNPRKRSSSKTSDLEPNISDHHGNIIANSNKDFSNTSQQTFVKSKEHRRKSTSDREKRRRLDVSNHFDNKDILKGEINDEDEDNNTNSNDINNCNEDDNNKFNVNSGDTKIRSNDDDVINAGKVTPNQTEIKLQRPLGLLAQHGLSIKSGSVNHNKAPPTSSSTAIGSGRLASPSYAQQQPHHALGHAPPLPPGAFYPGCFVFPPFQPPPHSSFPQAAFGHPVNPHHPHHPHQQLAQAVAAFQQRQQHHFPNSEDKNSNYHQLHQSNHAKNLAIKNSRSPNSPVEDKMARSDNEFDSVDGKRNKKKRRQSSLSPSNPDRDKFESRMASRNSSPLNNDSNRRRKNLEGGGANDDEEDDDEIEVESADNFFGDYRFRSQPFGFQAGSSGAVNENNRNNDYPFSVGTPGSDSNHGNFSLMDRRFMPSPPPPPPAQNGTPSKQEFNGNSNGTGITGSGGKTSPNSGGSSSHHWTFEEQFKQLYEMSNEPKRKDFLDELFTFMQKRGTPVNRIPIMAKQTLDLYELFRLVVSKGGLVEVINKKLWREITKGLNLPSSITSAAFTLRTQYMKYLYPFECEKMKLSTLAELQSAIDGNRREGRRPGYGYDFSPIPNMLHTPPNTHHHPMNGGPLRPMLRPPTGFPSEEEHQQMIAASRHPPHLPLALRSFAEHDARAMEAATRAMEEVNKRMEEASRSLQQHNNCHGSTSNGPPKSVFLTPPEPQAHLPASLSQAPGGPLTQPLNLTPTANGQLLVGSHLLPTHPHLPLGFHALGGIPPGLTGLPSQATPGGDKFESSASQQQQNQAGCKRPTFLDEARFMQQLAVNHANIKMTSQGGNRLDGMNSMLVSMEINGLIYQGVLFAQHPRRI